MTHATILIEPACADRGSTKTRAVAIILPAMSQSTLCQYLFAEIGRCYFWPVSFKVKPWENVSQSGRRTLVQAPEINNFMYSYLGVVHIMHWGVPVSVKHILKFMFYYSINSK